MKSNSGIGRSLWRGRALERRNKKEKGAIDWLQMLNTCEWCVSANHNGGIIQFSRTAIMHYWIPTEVRVHVCVTPPCFDLCYFLCSLMSVKHTKSTISALQLIVSERTSRITPLQSHCFLVSAFSSHHWTRAADADRSIHSPASHHLITEREYGGILEGAFPTKIW